jgi:hypothetical protein
MKETFGALFDTLYRAGMGRIACRLSRRFRHRCLYPWLGPWLFSSRRGGENDLDLAGDLAGLGEDFSGMPTDLDGLLREAEGLSQNRFRYLNLPSVNLGNPIAWRSFPYEDPLWLLQLHYGEWALVLAHALRFSGEGRFREALVRFVTDWVEHNPVGCGPGWEPYPTCLRLVHWSKAAMALAGDPGWQDFSRRFLAPSLRQQANYLTVNLEEDLGNNHLLANYRALAWMGLLFPRWPESARWRETGLQGLWAEMRRQVLADGVHDERSVSYHTLVLQDLLEIWNLCVVAKQPVPEDVVPTLENMLRFLEGMRAPDGSFPMLNDTVPGYPADPRSALLAGRFLMGGPECGLGNQPGEVSLGAGQDPFFFGRFPAGKEWAGLPALSVFPHAGYCVLRPEADHWLYFDAGPMGPHHLPGHGHADALSFLLFAGGRWRIVDPGVFSYHDRTWRDTFRSTPVHNTVAVDAADQCVFWGPFRVAYPPRVRLGEWGENYVTGEHDGYRRLTDPVSHRRTIRLTGPGEWEVLDLFSGRGTHDFLFNLQLAPGGRAEVSGLNAQCRWPDDATLKILCPAAPAGAKVGVETGWVSSGWNLKEEAPRYVLRWRGKVPMENRIILKTSTEC